MKDGNIIYAWQMDNDGGMTWIVDEKGSTFYINTNDVKKVENCYNCRREK
jgi:predicted lipoprotein with Yx(FWY)xxD motif